MRVTFSQALIADAIDEVLAAMLRSREINVTLVADEIHARHQSARVALEHVEALVIEIAEKYRMPMLFNRGMQELRWTNRYGSLPDALGRRDESRFPLARPSGHSDQHRLPARN